MNEEKPQISYDDFSKLDIRVGTISICEPVPGSEKLYRLEVNFGETTRQILSGIQKFYTPEQLIGRQAMFIVNLAPREMMGLQSNGMLVAGHGENREAVLYILDQKVPNGSRIS